MSVSRLLDRCRFLTPTVGTGNINVGSALTGHMTPAQAGVNNGDVFYVVIEEGANWEVANVTYSSTGPTLTRNWTTSSSNSGSAISLTGGAIVTMTVPATQTVIAENIPGLISGLTISATGTDLFFTVGPGMATSEDGGSTSSNGVRQALYLPASLRKNANAVWAAGANNGALDTGTLSGQRFYHVYLIGPDIFHQNLPVDILLSFTGPSTGPTLPTNYARWRRIGSIRVTSTPLVWNIVQVGDFFTYPAMITDISGGSLNTSFQHLGTTVPSGVNVDALMTFSAVGGSGAYILIGFGPNGANQNLFTAFNSTGGSASVSSAIRILTDTTSAMYVASNVNMTSYNQYVGGYVDARGRS